VQTPFSTRFPGFLPPSIFPPHTPLAKTSNYPPRMHDDVYVPSTCPPPCTFLDFFFGQRGFLLVPFASRAHLTNHSTHGSPSETFVDYFVPRPYKSSATIRPVFSFHSNPRPQFSPFRTVQAVRTLQRLGSLFSSFPISSLPVPLSDRASRSRRARCSSESPGRRW